MEQRKSIKIGLGTVVCIFIIFILVIALFGMWYYYNYVKFTDNSIKQGNLAGSSSDKIEDENYFENFTEENKVSLDSEDGNNINSLTNTFETYQGNYTNTFKELISNGNTVDIYPYPEYKMPGVYRIYLDSNNDVYFEFNEDSQLYAKYGKTYKVETGVANIFLCDIGNGGYADAIFLKLDGTASSVSGVELENNTEVKCEKTDGVENAVNVINYTEIFYDGSGEEYGSAPAVVFIDINGNVVKKY